LSCNHKEIASFFDLKGFLPSLVSDNHSTASSFQSTWPSLRSTAFASTSRRLPFFIVDPQAWVLVEPAFDFGSKKLVARRIAVNIAKLPELLKPSVTSPRLAPLVRLLDSNQSNLVWAGGKFG
jgi:hypothetical protein